MWREREIAQKEKENERFEKRHLRCIRETLYKLFVKRKCKE